MKKLVVLFLALAVLLCGCGSGIAQIKDPGATFPPEKDPNTPVIHTVTVTDEAGNKLSGIYVTVSLGTDQSYGGGITDENGVATMELPKNDDYTIVLRAIPDEYIAESSYHFTDTIANIVLKSAS